MLFRSLTPAATATWNELERRFAAAVEQLDADDRQIVIVEPVPPEPAVVVVVDVTLIGARVDDRPIGPRVVRADREIRREDEPGREEGVQAREAALEVERGGLGGTLQVQRLTFQTAGNGTVGLGGTVGIDRRLT